MKLKFKHFLNIISILLLIIFILIGIKGYKMGIFTSVTSLRKFLEGYTYLAPLMFMLLQVVQIVIPIIPGGVSTAFGVLMFGAFWGFVYNYISICFGSCLVFLISRYFGKNIMLNIFGEDQLHKYDKWLNNKKYTKFFALAILFPVAPDDFLCYFSGLTKMTFKEFLLIILICKPPSIFLYSMALNLGLTTIFSRFSWNIKTYMV